MTYTAALYASSGARIDDMVDVELQDIGRRFAAGDIDRANVYTSNNIQVAALSWVDDEDTFHVETDSDGIALLILLGDATAVRSWGQGVPSRMSLEATTWGEDYGPELDGMAVYELCDDTYTGRAAWFTDEADFIRWVDEFFGGVS